MLIVEEDGKEKKVRASFFCLLFSQREKQSVLIAMRVHPFPSRTRKLSSSAPKILVWRRTGKIGNADTNREVWSDQTRPLSYSSIAQLVEHAAVNRRVVGSSPTWGAMMKKACRHGDVAANLSKLGTENRRYGPLAQLVRATGS